MRKQPSSLEWRFADQEDANDKVWNIALLPTNGEEHPVIPTGFWHLSRPRCDRAVHTDQ